MPLGISDRNITKSVQAHGGRQCWRSYVYEQRVNGKLSFLPSSTNDYLLFFLAAVRPIPPPLRNLLQPGVPALSRSGLRGNTTHQQRFSNKVMIKIFHSSRPFQVVFLSTVTNQWGRVTCFSASDPFPNTNAPSFISKCTNTRFHHCSVTFRTTAAQFAFNRSATERCECKPLSAAV